MQGNCVNSAPRPSRVSQSSVTEVRWGGWLAFAAVPVTNTTMDGLVDGRAPVLKTLMLYWSRLALWWLCRWHRMRGLLQHPTERPGRRRPRDRTPKTRDAWDLVPVLCEYRITGLATQTQLHKIPPLCSSEMMIACFTQNQKSCC